jgi:hypothetical protein
MRAAEGYGSEGAGTREGDPIAGVEARPGREDTADDDVPERTDADRPSAEE